MANDHVKVRKRLLLDCLTCSLCTNPYKEATTICVCLHTFCKQCICQNLEDSKNNCCPVCKAYLGSFPEQLLRPDHNLCELVLQIFPSKTFRRQEDLSVSPPVVVAPKLSRLNAAKENSRPQNFGTSQDILRINCGDGEFAKFNIHQHQTLHNSSKHSANALKNQIKCDMELSQVESGISGPEANTLILKNKEMKKIKKMKRNACPLSGLTSDNRKIETKRSDQSGVLKSFGPGRQCDQASPVNKLPNESFHPVWLCLLASEEKNGIALPQIQKPYIRTMNGELTLSFVNKYLVKKLNLKHESEVEVLCCSHLLIPTLTLKDLVDIWVQATSDIGQLYINCNDGEPERSENFVVELTYRSSKMHRASP